MNYPHDPNQPPPGGYAGPNHPQGMPPNSNSGPISGGYPSPPPGWGNAAPAYGGAPVYAPVREGQSRLGMAGIVLAVLSFLCGIGMIAFTVSVMDVNNPPPDDDPMVMMVGALALGTMGLNFLGLLLSIIGLFAEANRGRATAWVGIGLNALPCLGCGGLMLLGLVAGSAGL
jgi:hypothetical protein